MERVTPKVFLIGETKVHEPGLQDYLDHIGVPNYQSDAPSDPEKLIEIMGRLCYKSFIPKLNPNVSKIREHNAEYIQNIIRVKHGSVIEHPMLNFIFADVSRVFTHELVRHRPGVLVVAHRLGFVLANAGIDRSNVAPEDEGEQVLLLPEDPDGSAAEIRRRLSERIGT